MQKVTQYLVFLSVTVCHLKLLMSHEDSQSLIIIYLLVDLISSGF